MATLNPASWSRPDSQEQLVSLLSASDQTLQGREAYRAVKEEYIRYMTSMSQGFASGDADAGFMHLETILVKLASMSSISSS